MRVCGALKADVSLMAAHITLVHDDFEFLTELERKLRAAGHDVAVFQDSISAYDALRSRQRIEILVTRVLFQPGRPHGVALAGAARITRPSLKVIFIALPEIAHHVADQNYVFIMPVHPDQIAQAIEDLLNAPPLDA